MRLIDRVRAPLAALSLLLLGLGLLGGACSSGRIKIEVRVEGLTPDITTLQVSVSGGKITETKTRKNSQGLDRFVVSLDAEAAGAGPLTLDLDALDARACGVAHGQEPAVSVHSASAVTVRLDRFAESRCQLRVRKLGTGAGSVVAEPLPSSAEPGIDCDGAGPRCKVSLPAQTGITLRTEPGDGSFFVGWSGSSSTCQGLDPCRVTTLDGEVDVRATFLPRTACRPDGWCWEQPKPQGASLSALFGTSPNQIWAVGNGGAILLWNGALWASYDSPVAHNLHGIWGSGKDDIWAVGDSGTIIHWDGLAWKVWPTSFTDGLGAIHGSGARRAVAVGTEGKYLEWDGTAWRSRDVGTKVQLLGVWADEDEAWAIADHHSNPSLPNHSFVHVRGDRVDILQDVTKERLYRIFGLNRDRLWAVTQSTVLAYDGKTWSESPGPRSPLQPAPTYEVLRAIWGTSEDDLWVAGNLGPYFHLGRNGYTPWSVTQGIVEALFGFGPNDIFAAGSTGLLSRWNGTQWVPLNEHSYQQYRSVYALSPKKVFAASLDGVISEFDGSSWRPRFQAGHGLFKLWGTGPDNLWAAGSGATVYRYDPVRDGWNPVSTGVTAVLSSMSGRSATDVWAVGQVSGGGVILHFDGTRWSAVAAAPGFLPTDVWDSGGQDVWMVGLDGWIVRVNRSTGASLRFTLPGLVHDIQTVWGSSPQDVWFAGYHEKLPSGPDAAMLRWNGSTLILDTDTLPNTDFILKLWGTSGQNIWASGPTCLLHYDGTDWSRAQGVQPTLLDFVNLAPPGQPPDVLAVGADSVVMRRKGY